MLNSTHPKISIIVPSYNQSEKLENALLSVHNSDYNDYEVIVVDDASDKDISAMVNKFGGRLIKLAYNQGPSNARNTGTSFASGKILLFIDSDVLIKQNTLSYINNIFNSSDIDCLTGSYTKECPHDDLISKFKNLFIRYSFSRLAQDVSCLHSSITAIKKDVFEQSGGFDKNTTKPGVEDIVFGGKLSKMGFKIIFDPNLEVTHDKEYGLFKLIKNDFNKGSDYIKAFLSNKWFDIINKKQHPNNNINFIISIPSLYISILSVILFLHTKNTFFLILIYAGTGSFLLAQSQFLRYLAGSEGVLFALKCVPLIILSNFVFGLAFINGAFLYFSKTPDIPFSYKTPHHITNKSKNGQT